MKNIISCEMINVCYKYAVMVVDGEITKTESSRRAVIEIGITNGSAIRTIDSISRMLRGESYCSTINEMGTDFILGKIYNDFGVDGLKMAIYAVQQHISYLKNKTNNKQQKIVNICNKYNELYKLN